MASIATVDGCKILHHQRDGGNMLKPYKQWEVFHLSTGAGFRNHPQYVTLPNGTRSETWEPQKSPVKGSPAPSSYWLVGGFHKWGYPKMDVL